MWAPIKTPLAASGYRVLMSGLTFDLKAWKTMCKNCTEARWFCSQNPYASAQFLCMVFRLRFALKPWGWGSGARSTLSPRFGAKCTWVKALGLAPGQTHGAERSSAMSLPVAKAWAFTQGVSICNGITCKDPWALCTCQFWREVSYAHPPKLPWAKAQRVLHLWFLANGYALYKYESKCAEMHMNSKS